VPATPKETLLRGVSIGLQAELDGTHYQLQIIELRSAQLLNEIQELTGRLHKFGPAHKASQLLTEKLIPHIALLNSVIVAIRPSKTWRIALLS
jgi:hypothetical protein